MCSTLSTTSSALSKLLGFLTPYMVFPYACNLQCVRFINVHCILLCICTCDKCLVHTDGLCTQFRLYSMQALKMRPLIIGLKSVCLWSNNQLFFDLILCSHLLYIINSKWPLEIFTGKIIFAKSCAFSRNKKQLFLFLFML